MEWPRVDWMRRLMRGLRRLWARAQRQAPVPPDGAAPAGGTAQTTQALRPEAGSTLARQFMAHELRSHLGIVISAARLLETEDMDNGPSRLRLLRAMRGSAQLLARLLDDCSGTHGPSVGGFDLQFKELALAPWLTAWCSSYLPERTVPHAVPGLQLCVRAPAAVILVDADRLGQCMWNLVSNAHKYGQGPRGVTIELDRRGDEIIVAVVDSGPGLDPAQMTSLFRPHVRLQPHGPAPGQGLGLALTKLLAGAMQGRVDVESRPGNGSRFALVFPSAGRLGLPASAPAPQATDRAD